MRGAPGASGVLACLSIYRAYYPIVADGFVFRTNAGEALDPDNWAKRSFAGIMARAEGLPAIGLHGLRHTYASLLINQGETLKYVSKQLGHASIGITGDLYAHMFKETSAAAMRKLDTQFSAAGAKGKIVAMPTRTGTEG